MSIKSILVPYSGAGAIASLNAALSVARAHNAHVEILHATPGAQNLMPIFLPQPGFAGEIFAELSSEASRHLETALSLCSGVTKRADIEMLEEGEIVDAPTASFHITQGTLETQLTLRARLADLVVMNLALQDNPTNYASVVRAALFRSGKPVLLIAEEAKIKTPPTRIVVGWNGSFEAARALKSSMPMLHGAEVLVYTGVEGHAPEIGGREVALYLKRHGINAEAKDEFLDVTAAAALRRACRDFGADLLVMGAYSREDRMRETLLGSLTGEILKKFDIPVMMAN